MRLQVIALGFAAHLALVRAAAAPPVVVKRSDCKPSFTACQPAGSSTTTLPPVGNDLRTLYEELLDSMKGINAKRDTSQSYELGARDPPLICCADGTTCLNLAQFDIPFCYDRFTTNFVLADGSSGTLDSGTLSVNNGPQVNLVDGSYPGGNIYAGSPPNTATLAIPTPYTSAGVGSAIPITALAGVMTVTTVIPGTTVSPSTLPATTKEVPVTVAETVSAAFPTVSVVGGTTSVIDGSTTTVGGSTTSVDASTVTISGTTKTLQSTQAPTTLSGTTILPKTSTYTTSISAAASSTGGAAIVTHVAGAGSFGLALAVLAAL